MTFVRWHLLFYLSLIFLSYQTGAVYSIQCCTGDDNTCTSDPVDCPSNICFKLVINKVTEERGCLDDLIKLLNLGSNLSQSSVHGNTFTSGSLNDQCQRLGSSANGMSLCRCTNHLCNSSSKRSPCFTFILFFLQLFLLNFLS